MTVIVAQSKIRTEIREYLRLAIPLAIAQVTQSATGFADSVMMGRLGQETLAAGGLAALTFGAVLITASGFVMGVTPLVAEAYGANRPNQIALIARQGLWLSLILTIPMMLLIGKMDTIMSQVGQAATTVTLANTYLDIMLWGFFPALAFSVLRGVVAALQEARPVMAIVIAGTLFNIAGNYVLGFGKLGFPQMGIAGLAVASVLSLWGMFLALVAYILRHKKLRKSRFFQYLHQIKPRTSGDLIRIGLPIGISSALEIGLFTVVTYLMGILGTDVLAAHQIVFQTIAVIFMIPLGMSFATTARVGQWFGQQNLQGATRAGYVSMFVGMGFMTLMTMALLMFPQQVIGLYLDIDNPANANVVALAKPMLTVAAISQILDSLQKTTQGALYGLQDTRIPMLLSLSAFWGVGLTSGFLLGFPLGLGGTGLWIGQSIGIAIAAIVFVWRLRKLLVNLRNNKNLLKT
jgi:MATE family multidrug resistance protein